MRSTTSTKSVAQTGSESNLNARSVGTTVEEMSTNIFNFIIFPVEGLIFEFERKILSASDGQTGQQMDLRSQ